MGTDANLSPDSESLSIIDKNTPLNPLSSGALPAAHAGTLQARDDQSSPTASNTTTDLNTTPKSNTSSGTDAPIAHTSGSKSGSPLSRGAGGVSVECTIDNKNTPLNPLSSGALPAAHAGTLQARDDQSSPTASNTTTDSNTTPKSNTSSGTYAQTYHSDRPKSGSPLLRGAGGVSNDIPSSNNSPSSSPSARREIIPYNPHLKDLAKKLRNNSTKSEVLLWQQLKGKFQGKYDFHRQKPLDNYIADFFCYELKLVIEIDGSTHLSREVQDKDLAKEKRLRELELNTLRFVDADVYMHIAGVVEKIKMYIDCFEKGDLSALEYVNTPLNPLSRGDLPTTQAGTLHDKKHISSTPASGISQQPSQSGSENPLLRGAGGVSKP